MRKCLGSDQDHTVFEGECVGQMLGLELLRREARGRGRIRDVTIGTDNQGGMGVVRNPGQGTARYLVDEVLERIQRVKKIDAHVIMELYWTSSHKGIPGNERADKEAKRAAEGDETETKGLGILRKPSKAVILVTHKKWWREEVEQQIISSPCYERLRSINHRAPWMTAAVKLIDSLPRRHVAILVQLRIGHCPLNHYLHWFSRRDSPLCETCHQAPETVDHLILECPAHDRHRGEMCRTTGTRPEAIGQLLSQEEAVKVLFRYIHRMQRFEKLYRDLHLAETTEEKSQSKKRRGQGRR